MSLADALAQLSDAELDAYTARAYAAAASLWSAVRRFRSPSGTSPAEHRAVAAMLAADAEHADDWYNALRAEAQRRSADA